MGGPGSGRKKGSGGKTSSKKKFNTLKNSKYKSAADIAKDQKKNNPNFYKIKYG